MPLEQISQSLLLPIICGLLSSVLIEQCLIPRPRLSRPVGAWCLHAGLWLLVYATLVVLLGRLWLSMAGSLVMLLVLVLVSNAKYKALREPFIFQDYHYFLDAITHPRLYIPFLGWSKFFFAVFGIGVAVAVGMQSEPLLQLGDGFFGRLPVFLIISCCGGMLLFWGARTDLSPRIDPVEDLSDLGFLASLWLYGTRSNTRPVDLVSPMGKLWRSPRREFPHLLAVQSESFFDPRPLFDGVRADVLAAYDRIRAESLLYGSLEVPAWGANTVRSEFAFLSGIDPDSLSVHRFNPYLALSAGWKVPTLASVLRQQGYRTICLHPYAGSFYRRDHVMPLLGFDEFLDIQAFGGGCREGPFVSDLSLARKILDTLGDATQPVFIFAITMENHGPLHLETLRESDADELFNRRPPAGCDDLGVYLRHLRNADRMIDLLRRELAKLERRTSFCWFGDHVPMMPSVYRALGVPSGEVGFFIWDSVSGARRTSEASRVQLHGLAARWLQTSGFSSLVQDTPDDSQSAGTHSSSKLRSIHAFFS